MSCQDLEYRPTAVNAIMNMPVNVIRTQWSSKIFWCRAHMVWSMVRGECAADDKKVLLMRWIGERRGRCHVVDWHATDNDSMDEDTNNDVDTSKDSEEKGAEWGRDTEKDESPAPRSHSTSNSPYTSLTTTLSPNATSTAHTFVTALEILSANPKSHACFSHSRLLLHGTKSLQSATAAIRIPKALRPRIPIIIKEFTGTLCHAHAHNIATCAISNSDMTLALFGKFCRRMIQIEMNTGHIDYDLVALDAIEDASTDGPIARSNNGIGRMCNCKMLLPCLTDNLVTGFMGTTQWPGFNAEVLRR